MISVCKVWALLITWASMAHAQTLPSARELYERTDYQAAQAALARVPSSPATCLLQGQIHYRLDRFSEAAATLEDCVRQASGSAETWNWLGKAQGRRAETSSPLRAPFLAGKARDAFEKAVHLDPSYIEGVVDLFSYYLAAPSFLGGGLEKAEKLAQDLLRPRDPAEYASALAQLAQARKQPEVAERYLRQAAQDSPEKRAELAGFLARQGRVAESDREFAKARELAPRSAQIVFLRARTLIEGGRLTAEARLLLEAYPRMARTPDDPTPTEARRLLEKLNHPKGN